ncbi:MAG: hypothetical protein ACYDEV_15080 [Acidiferrobacter sp.]
MHTIHILTDVTLILMWVGIIIALVTLQTVLDAIREDRRDRNDQRKKKRRGKKGRRTLAYTPGWWSGAIGTVVLFGVGPVAFYLAPPQVSQLAVHFFMVGGLMAWAVVLFLILRDILPPLWDIVRHGVRR